MLRGLCVTSPRTPYYASVCAVRPPVQLGKCASVTRVKAIRRFTVRTVLPESIAPLGKLAGNLRWSWHLPTSRLFEEIDRAAWEESGHDPVALLGSVTREKLHQLAADEKLVKRIQELGADLDDYLTAPRW